MLLACFECGETFHDDELKPYIETHGLDAPPYEEYYACPHCAGAYAAVSELDYLME